MEATAVAFANAARALGEEARRRGLLVPGFRSPPRIAGAARSLRRRSDGAVVAVTLRGRTIAAVLADMVDGVVAANGLRGARADAVRAELRAAVRVADSGVRAA
jgi:hypothetical protein